jgi:predicted amidohydrolase
LENQCYVIGVNITGDETEVAHAGDSAIIDAYGHTLAECPPDKAASASALLDMDTLQRFRQKFPVLADADPLPPLF